MQRASWELEARGLTKKEQLTSPVENKGAKLASHRFTSQDVMHLVLGFPGCRFKMQSPECPLGHACPGLHITQGSGWEGSDLLLSPWGPKGPVPYVLFCYAQQFRMIGYHADCLGHD